jgi:hypothetical protein
MLVLAFQVSEQEERQYTYKRNTDTCSNSYCCGKAINITHSECVSVALATPHSKRMRRIIFPSVASLALSHFFILSHKRHDFRKRNVLEHKICVLIFIKPLSEAFLILRITARDIIINAQRSSCKVPVILVRFKWKPNFLDRLSKSIEVLNFKKNLTVGTELFHADGRTHRWADGRTRHNEAD